MEIMQSDEWMTLDLIEKWYKENVNILLTKEWFDYMASINMIQKNDDNDELYNINQVNKFMLEYEDNQPYKNQNGKYVVKTNRINLINKILHKEQELKVKTNTTTNKQFKITRIDGNKLKLIKI